MINSANENQPMTMALVPTPLLTAPFPKSCAMTDAATEAVCCHKTETRTKIDAMKMMARETCDTAREGMARTTRSEPSESSSSYHDGKVARSRTHRKAKMMAMMLGKELVECITKNKERELIAHLHQIRKHNHVLKLTGEPNQVQGILVDRNPPCKSCGIVAAKPRATVRVDADAKVADASL